jgi:hypothetical protein
VLGDWKNVVRNSGGLSDVCKVFKFDLPAVAELPGTLSLACALSLSISLSLSLERGRALSLALARALSLFPPSFDDLNSDTLIGVLSVLLPPPSPSTSRGKH